MGKSGNVSGIEVIDVTVSAEKEGSVCENSVLFSDIWLSLSGNFFMSLLRHEVIEIETIVHDNTREIILLNFIMSSPYCIFFAGNGIEYNCTVFST